MNSRVPTESERFEGFEDTDIAYGNPTSKPNKLPLAPCSKKKERFACLSKLRQTNRPFFFAESEGFEPPIRRNAYTAFRVRLFRPLRQLS